MTPVRVEDLASAITVKRYHPPPRLSANAATGLPEDVTAPVDRLMPATTFEPNPVLGRTMPKYRALPDPVGFTSTDT